MVNQTQATAASLGEQATERRTNRSRIPEYPGSEHRHYSVFWIGTKEKYNEVEAIFLSNPIQFYAYRTAVEAKTKDRRTFPISALHQSRRYRLKNVSGVLVKETKEDEIDLYADVFGDVAERWVVIPALIRTPLYDERGNRRKFSGGSKKGKPMYREDFRFIELGPGSPALVEIQKAMEHPFFAKHKQQLIGSVWTITKKGKKPPTDGNWRLKTKSTETGEKYVQIDQEKLFAHVLHEANKEVSREDRERGVHKLYYSRFEDAYPFANPDQMRMALQLHSELLDDHPDFDKRYPAMIKRLGKDGELVGASTSDDTDIDTDIDDGEGGEVGSIDDLGDGDEVDFGGDLEDDDGDDTADDTDDTDVDPDDGDDAEEESYELEDGTPCDKDGNPLEASDANETDYDEGEEPAADEASEDPSDDAEEDASSVDAQEDAGIADEDGDTSAFDFSNEAEEETKAVKEKQVKKTAAESTPKKVVKKVTPKKRKVVVKKK